MWLRPTAAELFESADHADDLCARSALKKLETTKRTKTTKILA